MSTLQISLSEVAEAASRLRSLNSSMYDELQNMKKEMDLLNNSWVSDGSEEIRSRFNLFAARFEKEREIIDTYAAFLDLTVNTYESLETSITSNASGIQY